MKFSLNHPYRFGPVKWVIAFLVVVGKMLVIILIETLSIYALLSYCDLTSTVTSYLRFYAISLFDSVVFTGLGDVPFIAECGVPLCLLTIDTTTSTKNNWVDQSFVEKYGKSNKEQLKILTREDRVFPEDGDQE